MMRIVATPKIVSTIPTILLSLVISHLLANFSDTIAPSRQEMTTISIGTGKICAPMERMLELGADANRTDHYGRNALMEAVSEANKLCPNVNAETGEDYPGRIITPEMREDFQRIFRALIAAGADKENGSVFSGKTIQEHYEQEPV